MGIAHGDHPGVVFNNACTQQQGVGLCLVGLSVIEVAVQVVVVGKGVVKLDAELVIGNDLGAGGCVVGEHVRRHVQVR